VILPFHNPDITFRFDNIFNLAPQGEGRRLDAQGVLMDPLLQDDARHLATEENYVVLFARSAMSVMLRDCTFEVSNT
jgi:hypothetical protein